MMPLNTMQICEPNLGSSFRVGWENKKRFCYCSALVVTYDIAHPTAFYAVETAKFAALLCLALVFLKVRVCQPESMLGDKSKVCLLVDRPNCLKSPNPRAAIVFC